MVNETIKIQVVCPTVTTEDILTVALSALGVVVANAQKATPLLVARKASAGTNKDVDTGKVSISGSNLIINEGSMAFVTGDVFFIDLVLGEIPSAAAAATTTPT